jgi:hypothetical protein
MPRCGDVRTALLGAALLVALYNVNGHVVMVHDAEPNVFLAASFIERGSFAFSPSRTPAMFADPYARATLVPSVRTDEATGEPLFVSLYGPGAAVAAVPIFAAARPFIGDLLEQHETVLFGLGKIAASLFAAAAVALLYLVARRWVSWRASVFLAFAFGVGTATWSTSSQGLWQHAPTTFFLMLGTYLFMRGGDLSLGAAGSSLAAAVACRPTAVVFALAIGVHLLIVNRRGALACALGALPIVTALALYNAYWLGSPLRSGQASLIGGASDVWSTPFLEGLAGILVSPARGLLVFSPFLVLAVPGAVVAWRRPGFRDLRPLSVGVLLALLLHAKWVCWWGGHSYSYRIIVDLAGPLVLLTIPTLGWLFAAHWRRVSFASLLAWSVFTHALGAMTGGDGWNTHGDIDDPRFRYRLWSLTDNPIAEESAGLFGAVRARVAALVSRR